jgi:hypothetical protein
MFVVLMRVNMVLMFESTFSFICVIDCHISRPLFFYLILRCSSYHDILSIIMGKQLVYVWTSANEFRTLIQREAQAMPRERGGSYVA